MKITIEMERFDWIAIEEVLRYGIQNGEDRMIRELLLEAYDKKKMLMPEADKKLKLEPVTAITVAKHIDWFMNLVVNVPKPEYLGFVHEYSKNLNSIVNQIHQQTRTLRQ